MTMQSDDAGAALAAMRESRTRLAAAASCPPQRHLAFAGLLGGVVAAQAAPPIGTIVIEVLLILSVGLVMAWDRRRTGMFINGYRAGRTRTLTFSLLGFSLAVGALGVWLKHGLGLIWGPLACGVVVAVVAYFASSVWMRIYRRELQQTP